MGKPLNFNIGVNSLFGNIKSSQSSISKDEEVLSHLKEAFGNNKDVVSGIMGNIEHETGGSFDYQQKQYGGGSGEGLFQTSYTPMKKAYQVYLKTKKQPDSAKSQVTFMKNVLDSDEFYDIGASNRKKVKKAFESGDVKTITDAFSDYFERPGKPQKDKRNKASKKWRDKLGLLNPFAATVAEAGEVKPLDFNIPEEKAEFEMPEQEEVNIGKRIWGEWESLSPKFRSASALRDSKRFEEKKKAYIDSLPKNPVLRAKTPSLDISDEERKAMDEKFEREYNIDLIKKYPTNLYSGVPSWMDSFAQGILPLQPHPQPELEAAHPFSNIAGKLTGLAIMSGATAGISPAVHASLLNSPVAGIWARLYPSAARMIANSAQRGSLWGGKEVLDQLAKAFSVEGEVDVGKVASSTGFGLTSGLMSGIEGTALRIIMQGVGRGTWVAGETMLKKHKIESGDMMNIALNAALGSAIEAINAPAVTRAYKKAKWDQFFKDEAITRVMSRTGKTRVEAEKVAGLMDTFAMRLKPAAQVVVNNSAPLNVLKSVDKNIQAQYYNKLAESLTKGEPLSEALFQAGGWLKEIVLGVQPGLSIKDVSGEGEEIAPEKPVDAELAKETIEERLDELRNQIGGLEQGAAAGDPEDIEGLKNLRSEFELLEKRSKEFEKPPAKKATIDITPDKPIEPQKEKAVAEPEITEKVKPSEIPQGEQALAEEAKKFDTAEEFIRGHYKGKLGNKSVTLYKNIQKKEDEKRIDKFLYENEIKKFNDFREYGFNGFEGIEKVINETARKVISKETLPDVGTDITSPVIEIVYVSAKDGKTYYAYIVPIRGDIDSFGEASIITNKKINSKEVFKVFDNAESLRSLEDVDTINIQTKFKQQLTEIFNKAKQEVSPIPAFKNTNEALAFGESIRGDEAAINQLKEAKVAQDAITDKIQAIKDPTDADLQQGMNEAVKGQFLREAIESVEGKIKVPPSLVPPKKPPVAGGWEEEDWEFKPEKLTPKEQEALKEINKETNKEIKNIVDSLKNSLKGKLKKIGGEEEDLVPDYMFAKKDDATASTLDDMATEVADDLKVLGYEVSDEGLRNFIYENISQNPQWLAKKIGVSKGDREINKALRKLEDKKQARLKKAKKTYIKTQRLLDKILPPRKVKPLILKEVGITKPKEKVLTEEQALKLRLQQQTKGAKIGEKAGRKQEKITVKAILEGKFDIKMEKVERRRELEILKERIKGRAKLSVYKEHINKVEELQKGRRALSDEIKRKLKSIKKADTSNIPVEYKDLIEEIKEGIDFDAARVSTVIRRTKISRKLESEGLAKSVKDLEGIISRDMDIDDLRFIYDTVQELVHEGRIVNKLLSSEVTKTFDEAVQKGVSSIRKGKGLETVLPEIEKAGISKSKLKEFGKQYIAEHLRPELIFEILDNFKEGTNYNVVYKPMIKGEQAYMVGMENKLSEMSEILKDVDITKLLNERVNLKGIKRKLTRDEVMFIYVNSFNEANLNHLLNSGISEESIFDAANVLTEKEKDAAKSLFKFFDKNYDEINDVYKKLKGKNLPKEVDYFPIQKLKDVGNLEAIEMDMQGREEYRRTGVYQGFTKERVESKKAFTEFSFLKALHGNIKNVEYYKAFAIPIRDVSKYLKNPDVKGAIKENYSKPLYDVLDRWVEDIGRGYAKRATHDFIETLSTGLRGNFMMYALGGNLSTITKQPVSFVQGAGYIGEKWAIKGLGQVVFNPSLNKFINEKSVQLRNRAYHQERELEELLAGRGFAKRFKQKYKFLQSLSLNDVKEFKQMIKEGSMKGILMADRVTVMSIWKGAYDKTMAQTGSEPAAIEYADKAVRRTQPQSGLVHLPDVFKTRGFKGLLNIFKNQPNQNFNLLYETFTKYKALGYKGNIKSFTKDIWTYLIFGGFLFGVVSRKRLPKSFKEVGLDLVSQGTSGLIFLGDLVNKVKYPWGSTGLIDSTIATATKIITTKKPATKAKYLGRTVGIGLGVPGYLAAERAITRETVKTKLLGGERVPEKDLSRKVLIKKLEKRMKKYKKEGKSEAAIKRLQKRIDKLKNR